MFGGTKLVPDYDRVVSSLGGENNAFTNCDYTDYYVTVPADGLSTALWLEADRMQGLDLTQKALEVQQRVVTEEYHQRYMNQPYGDVWLLLRPLCYKVHPAGGCARFPRAVVPSAERHPCRCGADGSRRAAEGGGQWTVDSGQWTEVGG